MIAPSNLQAAVKIKSLSVILSCRRLRRIPGFFAPLRMTIVLFLFSIHSFAVFAQSDLRTSQSLALPPSAGVEDASDRRYYQRVRELIGYASKTLDISAESFSLSGAPNDPVTQLVEDLIRAAKRGVRVRVFLNTFSENGSRPSIFLREDILQQFKSNAVEVHFVDPTYPLTDRLVIADEALVLEGGLAWRKQDLEGALGSATLSHSESLARKKRTRLELLPLWDLEKEKEERSVGVVAAPLYLFQDHKYFPAIVQRDDGDAMKIYFALLRQFFIANQLLQTVTLEELGREIPSDRYFEKSAIEFQALKTLERLQNEYGLITLKKREPNRVDVQMLFPHDLTPAVGIPLAFFHENYAKDLSARAIFSYGVILTRSQSSGQSPVWLGSPHNVEQDFVIERQDFKLGVEDLRRQNLIEVFPFSLREGEGYAAPEVLEYRYLINDIPTVSERLAAWDKMRQEFGDGPFKKGRELADLFGEPEDPKVIMVFIGLLKLYQSEDILSLTQHVVSLPPKSTSEMLDYLRSLLKHETQRSFQLAT